MDQGRIRSKHHPDAAENQPKRNQDALERKNFRPVPLKLGDVHSGVSITTTRERGRPARTSRHSYVYLPHVDQPQTAPLPDQYVKDVPGLHPIVTPPLSGSHMR